MIAPPVIADLPDGPIRTLTSEAFKARVEAWVPALNPWTGEANDLGAWMYAAALEIFGVVGSAGFTATSTSSVAIGVGSKTFVIEQDRSLRYATFATAADAANAANFVHGMVTSYTANTPPGFDTVVINATTIGGSGTKTDWDLSLAGPVGPLPTKAAGSDIRTKTDDAKYVTAKALADADAFVTSSNTGSTTLDFSAGRNFQLTLTGNITLNVPSNMTDGQSGVIVFVQDATGSRTLSLNASIKKPGSAPTLSTAAAAVDRIGYVVRGSTLEITALEKALA